MVSGVLSVVLRYDAYPPQPFGCCFRGMELRGRLIFGRLSSVTQNLGVDCRNYRRDIPRYGKFSGVWLSLRRDHLCQARRSALLLSSYHYFPMSPSPVVFVARDSSSSVSASATSATASATSSAASATLTVSSNLKARLNAIARQFNMNPIFPINRSLESYWQYPVVC